MARGCAQEDESGDKRNPANTAQILKQGKVTLPRCETSLCDCIRIVHAAPPVILDGRYADAPCQINSKKGSDNKGHVNAAHRLITAWETCCSTAGRSIPSVRPER